MENTSVIYLFILQSECFNKQLVVQSGAVGYSSSSLQTWPQHFNMKIGYALFPGGR